MIYTGIGTIRGLSMHATQLCGKEYSYRTVHVKIGKHTVMIDYTEKDKRHIVPGNDDWLLPGIQIELSHSSDGYFVKKEISEYARKHPYTEWDETWPCHKVFGIELNS